MSKPYPGYPGPRCCTATKHVPHKWSNDDERIPSGKCCCGTVTFNQVNKNVQCKTAGCYYVNVLNSNYCAKHKEYRCKNCGDTVIKAPGAVEPFCSRECDIAWDNNKEQNGHRAAVCPVAVNVTTFFDTRPRYAHGDCKVVKLPDPTPASTLKFRMGNTEYTVEGAVVQIDRDFDFASNAVHLKLIGDVSTRQLHDEPHMQSNLKHGMLCACKCPDCWAPNRERPGKMICKCGDCGLKGLHH